MTAPSKIKAKSERRISTGKQSKDGAVPSVSRTSIMAECDFIHSRLLCQTFRCRVRFVLKKGRRQQLPKDQGSATGWLVEDSELRISRRRRIRTDLDERCSSIGSRIGVGRGRGYRVDELSSAVLGVRPEIKRLYLSM